MQTDTPDHRPPVIGLLGGVASGKSLVAAQLASLGAAVIDADRLGHRVVQEAGVRDRLVQRFGRGILADDGSVDRRALGRVAFETAETVEALNAIVHPAIEERFREAVEAARRRPGVPLVVLDAALLLEKRLDALCDRVVYIVADEEERARRSREGRGWDASELARRERFQIPLKSKRARADYLVENRLTPYHTLNQIRTLFSRIVNR